MCATPKYSAVSLFSGCGGSDLGMRSAGIETVWANDISDSACKLYDKLTGTAGVIHCGDIASFDKFPKVDILAGCYPCQGYSQGGKRVAEQDNRNFLYRQFGRVLKKVRPLAFIVENVSGLKFKHNATLFQSQIAYFRLAGYNVNFATLEARDFGLAQRRKRVFIVGVRSSEGVRFSFPQVTHGPGKKKYVTMRDIIWAYRNAPEGSFNAEPFHWYYLSRNRRREWDDQAPCVVAHWRHCGLHPDSMRLVKKGPDRWEFEREGFARRFSYIECAALQGFATPELFSVESIASRFRAIGNAVPPPLFAAVSGALVEQLSERKVARTVTARGENVRSHS